MEKGLFTVLEAAEYLACGRTKLFELLGSGELRVVKLGRSTRIPRHELDSWIATQTRALARDSASPSGR